MADESNLSSAPADDWIELPDRYIEVTCPCDCGHVFEIDLMEWQARHA